MRTAVLLILAAVLGGPACYRYVPAPGAAVPAEGEVRLRLNEVEANRLAGVVPPGTRALEGRVLEEQPDSVMLLVSVYSDVQGARVVNLNQRMNVARNGILDVEVRTLDRTQTTLVAAGAGVGLGVLIGLIAGGTFNSESDPDVVPPRDLVVPLFRFRW